MFDNENQPALPVAAKTFAGITQEQMAAHRREYGKEGVKALSVPLGAKAMQVIIRKPSRTEYERHTETLMKLREGKVGQALSANRTLVLACTLAPAVEEMAATLNEYPALTDKLAEPILNMAGADIEVREETF